MLMLLDIFKTCSTIQRINWYNLMTDKVAEQTDKKAKKVSGKWKWSFHKRQYLNPSNINYAPVSVQARKKMLNLLTQFIQFTDQQI